jgi:hypothetical protein
MSCSVQTTVLRSDSTSGRAIAFGTGVTTSTQWLDRFGVSTVTGHDAARFSPATFAYRCIMSRYVRTSGPPMSNVRLTSAGSVAHATR